MNSEAIAIIPRPVRVASRPGVWHLSSETVVAIDCPVEYYEVGLYLARELTVQRGLRCRVGAPRRDEAAVRLSAAAPSQAAPEAYRLAVAPDGADLRAGTAAGAFRAAQTLLQMIPLADGRTPCAEIEDAPRFAWRGMMLDCSRHFMPKDDILRFLDILALHKLNVFHWHLTDDQGWRFEVSCYPRLTEIGAWRAGTQYGGRQHCGGCRPAAGPAHGGFYTQRDCREVVAYAAERHIAVVPEIEMPGHCQAALAAYPHLACVDTPLSVPGAWGIHKNVYNAGKEEVFAFLEAVLEETLAVFPSSYIHIGGDECPKEQWLANALCRERMRRENLGSGEELQSWFVRRIERFLNSRGRNLIGWDEILEGGLAPNAAVMSWRGTEGGIAAAQAGHETVMCPNRHLYFDYCQENSVHEPLAIGGPTTLETVYDYEPVPAALKAEERQRIMGVQANLWTEYMPDFRHVQYMALPRAAALAEIAWSAAADRDFADFRRRLDRLCAHYDARPWLYRRPNQA
jgi:hexosaminidase